MRNAKIEDEVKKTEVAVALLEAYASLTCCCILCVALDVLNDPHNMKSVIIFGLCIFHSEHVLWLLEA